MTADALHAALSHAPLRLLIIAITVASPFVAAGLSRVVGPGGHHHPGTARGLRRGAAAMFVAAAILRLLGALLPGSGSPIGWLERLGTPLGGWFPVDAVMVHALVFSAVLVIATPLIARRSRDAQADQPLPLPLAWLVGASGFAAWVVVWGPLSQQASPIPGVDVIAAAPGALAALALAARARPSPATPIAALTIAAPEAPAAPPTGWRAAQAIGDQPFLAAQAALDASALQDPAWTAAGGAGPAPAGLAVLRDRAFDPRAAWHVPDVVDPADLQLTRALAHVAVHERGCRVLIVLDDAHDLGAAWAERVPGGVVRGAAAMAAAWSAGRLPAVWVISASELAQRGVKLLVDPRSAEARAWRTTLGLLLAPRLDRLLPLAATHASLALERLDLVMGREGLAHGVVSTGFGSPSSLSMLRAIWSDREVHELALSPRQQPGLSIWLADWRFRADSRGRWALRAVAAATDAVLADPGGTLDPADVGADLRGTASGPTLRRTGSWAGPASVAVLDARALVTLVRAIPHRTWDGAPHHHALWGLADDPVSRFLADADNLRGLAAAQRLHGPRVVVGRANRAILRAHLRAALSEAEQDTAGLVAAFGPSVVDEERAASTPRHRARRGPDGKLVRSTIVAMRPEVSALPPTVTDQTLELIDVQSGQPVGVVDALCAPTRLYPRRVLDLGGHRYEVPLHALDARRGRVELARVSVDQPLTEPVLTSKLDVRQAVETWQQVQRGRLRFRLGTFETLLTEAVSGVRRGGGDRVTYPAVEARYRTRIRAVGFDHSLSPHASAHLAACLGGVLRARLVVHDDDLGVVGLAAGEIAGWPTGVAIIDRNVQGLGVAEALDDGAVGEALEWVYAILHRCSCERGCARCTPAVFLEDGLPDKAQVLAALGG
jgi:hypothetical protein